jgi:hypothetical protein
MNTLKPSLAPVSGTVSVDRVSFIRQGTKIPQGQITQSDWVEIITEQIRLITSLLRYSSNFSLVFDCVRFSQGSLTDFPVTQETVRELDVDQKTRLHCLIPGRFPSVTKLPVEGFPQWNRSLFIDQGGKLFVYHAEQGADTHRLSLKPVSLVDLPLTLVDAGLAASVLRHNACVGYLVLAAIQDLLTKTLERKEQHVCSLRHASDTLALVTGRIEI